MKKTNYHELLVLGAHNFYSSPLHVLDEMSLDWDQKEDLLLNWKYYVMNEIDFEDPLKSVRLVEIHQALKFLKNRRNLH